MTIIELNVGGYHGVHHVEFTREAVVRFVARSFTTRPFGKFRDAGCPADGGDDVVRGVRDSAA